jgi:hypothetical protein
MADIQTQQRVANRIAKARSLGLVAFLMPK